MLIQTNTSELFSQKKYIEDNLGKNDEIFNKKVTGRLSFEQNIAL